MIKNKAVGLVMAVCAVALLLVAGCESGGNPNPTIKFRPTNSSVVYVFKDTTIYRGSVFNVGIDASKTGPDGFLKTFKIQRNINGGPDSTLLEASINTVFFSQYYSFQAGDSGNLEHYTFTVGNAAGLYSSVAFTDTVN
jgi:hypothetical protein